MVRLKPVRLDSNDMLPLARLLEEDDEPSAKPVRKPKRTVKDVVISLEDDDQPLPHRGESDDEIRLDPIDD